MTFTWAMGRYVSRTIRKALDPELRKFHPERAAGARSIRASTVRDHLLGMLARVIGLGAVLGALVFASLLTLRSL